MYKHWYQHVVLLQLATPSPTLKQWAWWKDLGLLVFPAFSFLPIRMKAECLALFPPPSAIKWGWVTPARHPAERCTIEGLQCKNTHTHKRTCTAAYHAAERHTQLNCSWVMGHWGCCQKGQSGWKRVLRGGNGSQGSKNKNCLFFQHAGFKWSLTLAAGWSTWRPGLQPSNPAQTLQVSSLYTVWPKKYCSKYI